MLAPGTCVVYDAPNVTVGGLPRLTAPRRLAGLAVRRNLALVVGGIEPSGPSSRVDRFDQAAATMLDDLPALAPMGPTRGLTLSQDESLFVGTASFRFRFQPMSPPVADRSVARFAIIIRSGARTAQMTRSPRRGTTTVANTDCRPLPHCHSVLTVLP